MRPDRTARRPAGTHIYPDIRQSEAPSFYRQEVTYAVQTPVFEGPFDLLLHLILSDEVDVYEVSLTSIVDAYLVELDKMEHLNLEVATEFLLIAATLVELKTRRLLPGDENVDLDEELALWEERDLLLARLVECKTFKDAAVVLSQLASMASRSAPRRAGLEDRFIGLMPDLLTGVTANDICAAFLRAVAPKIQPHIDTEHIAPIRASVVEAVEELIDELPRIGSITFRRLTAGFVDRIEIVVRFLAILEMFKQGLVELEQASTFGDITIEWVGDRGGADLASIDVYDG
jgi:segregation and condensation protein A